MTPFLPGLANLDGLVERACDDLTFARDAIHFGGSGRARTEDLHHGGPRKQLVDALRDGGGTPALGTRERADQADNGKALWTRGCGQAGSAFFRGEVPGIDSLYAQCADHQLASEPSTTPFRTISVLSRSFATALRHMTRMQLASTAEFAEAHGMGLEFTAIPMDYPQVSPLDFSQAAMGSLFGYGLECAEQGRLWTTVDQALSRADDAISRWHLESASTRRRSQPACPFDVGSSSGELRATDAAPRMQASPDPETNGARKSPRQIPLQALRSTP